MEILRLTIPYAISLWNSRRGIELWALLSERAVDVALTDLVPGISHVLRQRPHAIMAVFESDTPAVDVFVPTRKLGG